MTTFYQDIKDKLARLHVLEQLIVINTVVFLLNGLLSLLIPNGRFYILDFLSLSNNFWDVLIYPWTLLTYGFLHHSFSHLFFLFIKLFQSFLSLSLILLNQLSVPIKSQFGLFEEISFENIHVS